MDNGAIGRTKIELVRTLNGDIPVALDFHSKKYIL
jgi:hypothetical protein